MGGLKVIALISGGKDSLFSVLHCLANGHEVVALANLHPPALASEDIDSFMYQTVGHAVVPLYAEALGIPLFRQAITGGVVNGEREYAPCGQGEDETEDLVPLLRRVVAEVPGADAVCSGAILSTYQRTRVESVAVRLGLVPLSYLWQYLYLPPYGQTSLLEAMRAVGQVAKIVKVASGGLDESFLWQDVTAEAVIARMRRRMEMFGAGQGGALIGEGGEFETLALDGPSVLWKKRIEVQEVEKISGEGGSSFARLSGIGLAEKDEAPGAEPSMPRISPLLDVEFERVLRETDAHEATSIEKLSFVQSSAKDDLWRGLSGTQHDSNGTSPTSDHVQLANIQSAPYGSTADQMTDIVHQTLFRLRELGLGASHIAHATILLRDMSTFAKINPIYGSMFTKPNPPSRVTVACGELMPSGVDISLSIIVAASKEAGTRRGLHVQSRSYWAPANIGPYSQAISLPLKQGSHMDATDVATEPRVVHVAGQIPLVPASMEMITAKEMPRRDDQRSLQGNLRDFLAQAVLSLQHLWRIGRAMDVTTWAGAVAYISQCAAEEAPRRAEIACKTWLDIHRVLDNSVGNQDNAQEEQEDDNETEDFDVWDLKNRVGQLSGSLSEEGATRPSLPDFSRISIEGASGNTAAPPVFVAQVAELPRGADIEWFSTGISAASEVRYTTISRDGYSEQTCSVATSEHSHTEMMYVGFESVEGFAAFMEREGGDVKRTISVYTTKALPAAFWTRFHPMMVPCFGIWGLEGGELKQLEVLIVMRKDIVVIRS